MDSTFQKINEDLKDQYITNLEFILNNMTFKDSIISKYLYTQNKEKPEILFQDITKEIVLFFTRIQNKSSRISVMDAVIKSSPREDELYVDTLLKYKKFHLTPFFHQFLNKSNTLSLKGNFTLFNTRFPQNSMIDNPPHIPSTTYKKSFILEDEISTGIDYKHDCNKIGFFLQNSLFFSNNFELINKFKYSVSDQDIKRKKDQRTFKTVFSRTFYERPFIFRENIIFDPISRLNLQYSHKIIENKFDEYDSSLEMKTEVPVEDSLHQFKLSFTSSKFFNYKNFIKNKKEFIPNNNAHNNSSQFFKVSSSLNQTINSSYVENKLFFRRFFNFENLMIYQLNLEVGALILNQTDKKLKIPENFFINNFKGIYNPGQKVIVEEGKTGDCIGNNYYLAFKNKFMYNNIPLLSNYTMFKDGFEISPFVFANFLVCGNSNKKIDKDYDMFHYSTGFGLNLLTDAFNVEVFYNLYVKKNKYDIGKEFSINFGLD